MFKTSKQPRKQRKARYNAPLHMRQKFMGARLNSDLSVKYNTRSAHVIVGDTVTVMRGDYKGVSGKVEKVDLQTGTIHVSGVVSTKVNGEEVPRPIYPSVVMITKLELKDKTREARIRGKE
ncbi:50S ribosomal protein L24 [Methanimicrococcus blatticola]|uniref:Large ribosomal subunit protein uL24 n=1 Tax=Methanimicrococcus blatticola TaxID=91560 RepID=A0A484F541_9EURY|nr:50S ribosomal protein L24 [Methanimicrococcus blatticola]MBZ3936266.1 50S ribosomal protein L24 [Methanimicrococcus blatticola]MCC2508269.1 50S ribosomal protein L24 [Methanimicrococcus blatticola]TDQ70276.1 LSU ribosomal protein L24P [Methanimicrococcus blatticola]